MNLDPYLHFYSGFNFRSSDFNAQLGIEQLKLNKFVLLGTKISFIIKINYLIFGHKIVHWI